MKKMSSFCDKVLGIIVLNAFLFAFSPVTEAQLLPEGYWHNKERILRYTPDGEDFVIINGDGKFNRALYGTNTGFRVETGDLPEFGLYLPGMGGNMQLGIIRDEDSKWLNDAQYIKSVYRPGARIYEISDPFAGQLRLTVLAMGNAEGMIIRVETQQLSTGTELFWIYGGASTERFSREGDLGADPPDCFALKPDACRNNKFSIVRNTFDLSCGSNGAVTLTGTFPEDSRLKLGSPYAVTTPLDVWLSQEGLAPVLAGRCRMESGETYYLAIQNKSSKSTMPYAELHDSFEQAEAARQQIAGTLKIHTPDPYFNTLGGALSIAADGIWEPESWLHGAIGWRMRLNGWRAAYTGDIMGWHDRARGHFNGYAASQTVNVDPVIPHPAQDKQLHLARAEKTWGTPMYSNGYICRNPYQTGVMHHYDMNLCYIDELLWHFNWTGDMSYVRNMWQVLERHLAWEKRNFDPDGDGLYDAYASIWASDALQYSSGGVTHSSAYNYRANRMAAEIARKIGKNPKPYASEADKILKSVNKNLWLRDLGYWAEYKDFMGHKRIHPNAAIWTVYHAIDSEVHDVFQAYQATRYVDTEIPHIPVRARGLKDEGYAVVATTNWLPYSWSINNVAFAEVNHTALAYWQSGRYEEAFKLLKSSILDGMYLGASPGNFGQISFYDAARGECYRDFGDPVGVASRALVQGLFGICPDAMNERWVIRPGFPDKWDHASITTPDVAFTFNRKHMTDIYLIEKVKHNLELLLKARTDRIVSLTVNGKKAAWSLEQNAAGYPLVKIKGDRNAEGAFHIQVVWGGKPLEQPEYAPKGATGGKWTLKSSGKILKLYDPQTVLTSQTSGKKTLTGTLRGKNGHRTLFVLLEQGEMQWWQPVHVEITDKYGIEYFDPEAPALRFAVRNHTLSALSGSLRVNPGNNVYTVAIKVPAGNLSAAVEVPDGKAIAGANRIEIWVGGKIAYQTTVTAWNIRSTVKEEQIALDKWMNASVSQIFKNEYLSPRSPYTTLQIPTQGIGEWCHPLMTADIDDSGLRTSAKNGLLSTPLGISFRTPSDAQAPNIIFTSLWDNYPETVTVPLRGKASHAYLLMAGSTNHMQCHVINAVVAVEYTDGSTERLELVNPETWTPIEQDFYVDGQAFRFHAPRPYRVHLKSGLVSRNLQKDLNISGVYGRPIDGGAGIILDVPLNNRKDLKHLRLTTVANEVVVGLMGVTLVR